MWHADPSGPQGQAGLVAEGFKGPARRWRPMLNVAAERGVDCAEQGHAVEDLRDGASNTAFLGQVDEPAWACLVCDPSDFELRRLVHLWSRELYRVPSEASDVNDTELRPHGCTGADGGRPNRQNRAGGFRASVDGLVDSSRIVRPLTEYGDQGDATVAWHHCLGDEQEGADEGAPFIERPMIQSPASAFGAVSGGKFDGQAIRVALELG